MSAEPTQDEGRSAPEQDLGVLLHSRGYLGLLLVLGILGIPLSLVAFGFLVAVHELEHLVWHTLPESLGYDGVPAWWPVVALGLAGVLVALAVTHLPGRGGHVPADGMAAGATPPSYLPGVVLAAGASLTLGAVVGPEAPLIALGSGLALLAIQRTKVGSNPQATAILAATGSSAAISAIFGNPLIAAILFLEVAGLARRRTMLVILPCLVSSGIGALVFTGLGNWTGLEIGALTIPSLPHATLEPTDVLWTIPLAALVAGGTWCVFFIARKVAAAALSRTMVVTIGAGLLAGCGAAVYALVTGRSAAEVALSGESAVGTLASDPSAWSTGALALLVLIKGGAYALCLGAFRGGPVFPAIFLGAAFGTLASDLIPSIGPLPGLAIGMAAGVAVTRLPVTSVLLVVLLLGDAATDLMPVIILAAVTAIVIDELLSTPTARVADNQPT